MGLMTSMTSSSFRRFRDRSIVYVDKSLLIKDILSDDQNNVFLFTRPRRFGKSMNISMLDAFFNVKYAGNSWFDGLKISDHPECNEYKNKHPVIYMDLKDLNSRTYELYVGSIKGVICKVCCDHEELLQSYRISDHEMENLNRYVRRNISEDEIHDCIPNLMRMLEKHYGSKVVVLIDEYDASVTNMIGKGFQEDELSFLGIFLSSMLKGNENLEFAYMTGVTQLAKAGLFSRINNVKVNNILSRESQERFGFTEDEVRSLLEEHGYLDKLDEIREHYDGYHFGNQDIYNPFSIMSYLQSFEPKNYWINTANNMPIRQIFNNMSNETLVGVVSLLNGGMLHSDILDIHSYEDLEMPSMETTISVLAMAGYLSPRKCDDGLYDLKIPNMEVREGMNYVLSRCVPLSNNVFSGFNRSLLDLDVESMEGYLTNVLSRTSYFDMKDESHYCLVILLMTTPLTDSYDIRLQVESGNGRVDILFRPIKGGRRPIIIEVKKVDEESKLEQALDHAMEQIDDRRYDLGMDGAVRIGMAFCGKVSRVRVG